MKKKMIAAGAASLALAAMPVVGVFADTYGAITDTVRLTVNEACKMEASKSGDTYNLGAAAAGSSYGGESGMAGTPMTITCNTQAGWSITAEATSMSATGNGATSQTIPFGAYNTTTSVWSAAIGKTGSDTTNATIASGWSDWTATSAAAGTTIISGNTDTAVNGLVVTPAYKAYAASNQAAGTYQGTITYTFVGALTPSNTSGN